MPYADFHPLTDRLAVGAMVSTDDDLPFDAVLSMETHAPVGVAPLVRAGRIDYQWRSIVDGYSYETSEEIVHRFDDAADLVHRWQMEGKRVLVHCTAGVSRSVSAVIWYLMKYQGYTWDGAFEEIRATRAKVNPNILFEIPLRLAAGERFSEGWLEDRIEAYVRRVAELIDLRLDPQEIRQHLYEQGTLPVGVVGG